MPCLALPGAVVPTEGAPTLSPPPAALRLQSEPQSLRRRTQDPPHRAVSLALTGQNHRDLWCSLCALSPFLPLSPVKSTWNRDEGEEGENCKRPLTTKNTKATKTTPTAESLTLPAPGWGAPRGTCARLRPLALWRNGRRARLKIECRKASRFDPGEGYQNVSRPPVVVGSALLGWVPGPRSGTAPR